MATVPPGPPRASSRQRSAVQRLTADTLGQLHISWFEEPIECFMAVVLEQAILEPLTVQEALGGPQKDSWRGAMDEELKSLLENQTWELVEKPVGVKTLGTKWVFKIKRRADNSIAKFKGRLVVKGYLQEKDIDFKETFAPVFKYQSLRILLCLANQLDLHIHQMDVKTAFLNGELQEDLYIEQPEGVIPRINKRGEKLVCKLKKSLYGLKQAPRSWNKKLDFVLTDFGFQKCGMDNAIYILKHKEGVMILALYVDDMLLIGSNMSMIEQVKDYLKESFTMTDLGEAETILGIGLKRNKEKGYLCLEQRNYCQQILTRFNMEYCSSLGTPLQPGEKLASEQEPKSEGEKKEMENVPYRQAVGSLMYLMVSTRPDLAAAVGIVSRYFNNPGKKHWETVKKVFRYLQRTKSVVLFSGSRSWKISFSLDTLIQIGEPARTRTDQ